MNLLNSIGGILKWATDPKNRKLIGYASLVVLVFLLMRQCNRTAALKEDMKKAKEELQRDVNNYKALQDTINKYIGEDGKYVFEKDGLNITEKELKTKYNDLFEDYTKLKKEKVKTIVQVKWKVKEVIVNVPVEVTIDSLGNNSLTFKDSVNYSGSNFRYLSGRIPFKIDTSDLTIVPNAAELDLSLGMGLNTGLFKDEKTGRIIIRTETDYPGIEFTEITGADIMEDEKSRKLTKEFRKPWSVGINAGYGIIYKNDINGLYSGPYVGIGIQYHPKSLQWGK